MDNHMPLISDVLNNKNWQVFETCQVWIANCLSLAGREYAGIFSLPRLMILDVSRVDPQGEHHQLNDLQLAI
jgi:hypothetical protein